MTFLQAPTRILFFTGKGGVGKTTSACAAAVRLADTGKRVLLVSTDPASNLDDVLGVSLHPRPTPVPEVPGLSAMNLDPQQSAAEYRERMVGPYRNLLPAAAITSMEEQFSGSCTVEIAAFDEFARLLGDSRMTAEFDHVIFDTAPTGHTLRLLTLPSAWSGFMDSSTTGTSCIGPLAGLQAQQQLYRDTVDALGDSTTTTIVLVTRPEQAALKEAARTSGELAALGVRNQRLLVNGLFQASDPSDQLALALQQRGESAMKEMPAVLRELPRTVIPLGSQGVLGVEALRRFGTSQPGDERLDAPPALAKDVLVGLGALTANLAEAGHGVILTMGKGGVGKTTIAAAIAVSLAERGLRVHLTTTDPAAHIAATLASESLENLTVGRVDPTAETARYQDEVMQTAGSSLDERGKELLAEDLRSPCTEEIAVFRAFAAAVAEGTDRFVVLDTAPTGHTVLLLDAALAYHREVLRQADQMPEAVQQLLPRLRDPAYTRVLIVTLPEATPVHEAAQLQHDLQRAQIEPFAWVINQSLLPLTVTDPFLSRRRAHETTFVNEVITRHSERVVLVPWQQQPPVGIRALKALAEMGQLSPTPGN
ncbi:arsenical pump-driving ATPase [Schlesneria sp.]|uniref:arsenical pump-driving ATPase n=1 Tax=Schlesneria sp. TaxID=2762018 RepID=UPI003F7D10D0